ncbi:hypothetical protein [Hathewaya massiliensis]|uniref:hypothetical protein n=1 Tax=Hathewaya massiliensis TaxID=1964382 RepID=UPI00163BEC75|nr:hypothetical protein [Hathewaya massiliensis]
MVRLTVLSARQTSIKAINTKPLKAPLSKSKKGDLSLSSSKDSTTMFKRLLVRYFLNFSKVAIDSLPQSI